VLRQQGRLGEAIVHLTRRPTAADFKTRPTSPTRWPIAATGPTPSPKQDVVRRRPDASGLGNLGIALAGEQARRGCRHLRIADLRADREARPHLGHALLVQGSVSEATSHAPSHRSADAAARDGDTRNNPASCRFAWIDEAAQEFQRALTISRDLRRANPGG
jgi:hypothetical protein